MELWRALLFYIVVLVVIDVGEAQLRHNFYESTCPNVELIVRQTVMKKVKQTFVTVPATLRLFLHDCFVEFGYLKNPVITRYFIKAMLKKEENKMIMLRIIEAVRQPSIESLLYMALYGCDASILISSSNGDAEKDADDNLSLAGDGFDTVIQAKQEVESACPGVVSCADILAMAARDVVALTEIFVLTEYGRISSKSRVPGNLPSPDSNLEPLTSLFAKNNLTLTDMIALSGAHTVGFSHCNRFSDRLYSPSGVDPSLNPIYAGQLMRACPQNVDPSVAINMDPSTPNRFDNAYFTNLVSGRGLFRSDQVLFGDPTSRPIVNGFARDPRSFMLAFSAAMVKLGRAGVKIGDQGGIRRDCSVFS
ncbi:peroxidase 55-like [Asparagus officinalis]|uniref:peroxidase 55-like n=1 Tax=Asparagus officinalis TaxID=4686 RepID=UPI00098E76A5|nr:peroxidase 55-like [Asparagus officinalis]